MGARLFGADVLRAEDRTLLKGSGQYVDDIRLEGTLHGAFLRSPHAHAIIKSIDQLRPKNWMSSCRLHLCTRRTIKPD